MGRIELAKALISRSTYFDIKGKVRQALRNAEDGLALGYELGDHKTIASALVRVGSIYYDYLNDAETAHDHFEAAWRICQEISDLDESAYIAYELALSYWSRDDPVSAKDLFEKSIDISRGFFSHRSSLRYEAYYQFIAIPDGPEKAENILGAYYTPEQMRQALKKATKKPSQSLLLNRIKSGLPRTSATAFLLSSKSLPVKRFPHSSTAPALKTADDTSYPLPYRVRCGAAERLNSADRWPLSSRQQDSSQKAKRYQPEPAPSASCPCRKPDTSQQKFQAPDLRHIHRIGKARDSAL
jgi:tetratricopeptide (TPR) repeat protein